MSASAADTMGSDRRGRTGPRVIFVSGLSGSGRSTAMAALEDLSFYGVDNLPAQLVRQFLELCAVATPPIDKIALAVDAREERFLAQLPDVVRDLKRQNVRVGVLFLEASNETLLNRYRETRRVHPLSPGGSVLEGVERERELLQALAGLADYVIDTSEVNVHQLKERVVRYAQGRVRGTVVNLISFGFRYGTPRSVELLFDLRFLPNPYFERGLREHTGQDPRVSEYVLKSERGREFFDRLVGFLGFLLPLYDEEGKAYITIGIGCTGGKHRSVATVEALHKDLRSSGREINVEHRDMERE